jgi:hypothetical protein
MCNLKQNPVLIYSISGNHWTEVKLSSPAILSLLQTSEFEKGKTFALPESKRLSWNFILFFIEAKILPLEDIEKKQPGCQLRGPRSCLEVPSLMGNWRKPGAVR